MGGGCAQDLNAARVARFRRKRGSQQKCSQVEPFIASPVLLPLTFVAPAVIGAEDHVRRTIEQRPYITAWRGSQRATGLKLVPPGGEFIRSTERSALMGKGLLLWLIGIPIPIILLLWIFGFLH
jgi:hypothetical protein